jgi:hypothetical protein
MNKTITRNTDGLTKVPARKTNWMTGFTITPSTPKTDIDYVESDRHARIKRYTEGLRK